MKTILILMICTIFISAAAQNNQQGIFQFNGDIGDPVRPGGSVYNNSDQNYNLRGGGYNIWFERDEFHYLYNKLKGDFIMTANFEFAGKGINRHRKTGWMIRESADESAPHISATLHGDGLTVLQWRPSYGSAMKDPQYQLIADSSGYNILQIERAGKLVIMRAAHTGSPLVTIGSHEMSDLQDEVLAGIFICSHDPEVTEEVRVWNVRLDKPAGDDYNTGREGFLGCRLETINVFNGQRKIIYEKAGRFEAPNWMPDGKSLLFNMDGLLYKIPVAGGKPVKLNTDFANRNNNDHGISFNGKLLAISHQREGFPGGGSSVYILPISGGIPQLLTENTPSYWHGWSPDNKEVIYVGKREGKTVYNIYRKAISGGKEVALTDIKEGEHVDGCEYSPDGKYIYYNGNHTGTMQIWRMRPDGTGREQLTFDKYNDWFPHVSPDGKWVVMISFPADIDPNSHPSYKRVMLRLMPSSGGEPRVIAHLYGGQGTINVPSWSPDSKQIAFVSNSGK